MNILRDDIGQVVVDLARPKNFAIAVFGLCAIFLAYKTLVIYFKRRKYRHIPGPPTKGITGYYMGNLGDIMDAIKKDKVITDVFVKWHETYGEVFKYQMMDDIIVITSEKNAIKDILITKNFPKFKKTYDKFSFPSGSRFLGVGLVTDLDNEHWKQHRAIFNPGFHRQVTVLDLQKNLQKDSFLFNLSVLLTFVSHFNQIVDTLSDKLRTRADGKTVVGLANQINRTTLDAIALIAFGMHTDSISVKDSPLNFYLSETFRTLQALMWDPFMKYKPSKMSQLRELKNMINYIRTMGKNRILERIAAFKNNEHCPDDILSSILASYKGDNLDIEAMTDDFVTFFVAGQETTANTLAFVFLELGRRPDLVVKAREEIDRVLGERTDVTFQDFNDLKYCSAIFKEALRLYPAAPFVERMSNEKMNINEYEIPENTHLLISTYMNARYEKYFKNAYEFNPDRFIKTTETQADGGVENYTYLPFSLGPRNCIGQNFAQLEGVVVIAKLLQKFDFKLDMTQSFASETTLTLKPKDGTRVYVSLRS